ncbi:hypothetical protein OROMI_011438 [Orobanche minor]
MADLWLSSPVESTPEDYDPMFDDSLETLCGRPTSYPSLFEKTHFNSQGFDNSLPDSSTSEMQSDYSLPDSMALCSVVPETEGTVVLPDAAVGVVPDSPDLVVPDSEPVDSVDYVPFFRPPKRIGKKKRRGSFSLLPARRSDGNPTLLALLHCFLPHLKGKSCKALNQPKSLTFKSGELEGWQTRWILNPSELAAALKSKSQSSICGLALSC